MRNTCSGRVAAGLNFETIGRSVSTSSRLNVGEQKRTKIILRTDIRLQVSGSKRGASHNSRLIVRIWLGGFFTKRQEFEAIRETRIVR